MTLSRVKVVNQGSTGGAASTTFYFRTVGTTELNALSTFLTSLKALWHTSMSMIIPASGDVIDDADGHLLGSWSATAPSPIVGTGLVIASSASGIEIAWLAADVVDGHRPVGKTLIVPTVATAMTGTGAVSAATITTCNNAGALFLTNAVNFAIWHRPRKADPGPPPVSFRPGIGMTPGGVTTRSIPAVLRSRRS